MSPFSQFSKVTVGKRRWERVYQMNKTGFTGLKQSHDEFKPSNKKTNSMIRASTFRLRGQRYRVMIPETDNPQKVKSLYPGKPGRHVQADPGRYFTQNPQCWILRGTAHLQNLASWKQKFDTELNLFILFLKCFKYVFSCKGDKWHPYQSNSEYRANS